ncbi:MULTISPECIES: hypothetical protein [Maribacter]|uniref:hypothetical protein n=1 Tax=Maribacter TaxID=252356 RepID=UPI00047D90D1|nr:MULTISPECIES: hypothetical protein [Maribacter]|tara:strand:- start:190 stop:1371 length:1182 start_codon:yes stop_codon:yes gene_type:complete
MSYTKSSDTLKIKPSEAAKDIYNIALANRELSENSRKLAPEIIEKLTDYELFRMALPKHLGGIEDNPVETLKTYETLASAETSVAWIVWNNHLACTFGKFLNKTSINEIYKNKTDIYANSTRPEGFAKIVPDGYMVSGRWTLVSGCELADWFVLRCLVTGGDLPTNLGPGAKLKLMYVPKKFVKIIDTWNVGGLRGTGSHDIEIEEAFVQESYAVDFESTVENNTAYNRLPIGAINASGCAAMSLGLLKGAIDELTKMCLDRVTPGKNPDLRDRLTVQTVLAKANSALAANRAQLHSSVSTLWEESVNENIYTDVQLADVWAASCEAATAARFLISEIYAVAGTSSLYTKFRIERIHRDVHAVLQHGIIQPHWMNQAGMAYVGLKPTAAMFRI